MGRRSDYLALVTACGALAIGTAVAAADGSATPARSMYLLKCSGCHRADGQGAVDAGVPPFPGFVGSLAADANGRNYMLHVPGVRGSGLSDADLTRVMNYLLDTWSPHTPRPIQRFTSDEVSRLRAQSLDDVVGYRRTLVARLRKTGAPIAAYPWP